MLRRQSLSVSPFYRFVLHDRDFFMTIFSLTSWVPDISK